MPINPNALGDSAPEEQPKPPAEEPKRTRRTKAQMIADAVVPADDAQVELRDAGTGAKIQRPWVDAVALVRKGEAEWSDKSIKYALMKYDQQKANSAFAPESTDIDELNLRWSELQRSLDESPSSDIEKESERVRKLIIDAGGADPASDASYADRQAKSENIPPEAEVGDEVLVNSDVFRVGHSGVLTNQHSPISIGGEIVHAKRRWQRGADNEWRSADLASPTGPEVPAEQAATPVPEVAQTNGKGDGEVNVQSERLPRTQEHLEDGSIKIGTGILEKIGMPDYSSFQVGPITISRTVFDDGRRTVETFDDGREREVITAAVEGFDLLDNTVEFVAKRFRGQLISFLEATGSLKQPVS